MTTESDRSARRMRDLHPSEQHHAGREADDPNPSSRLGRNQIRIVEAYQNSTSKTDPDVLNATNTCIFLWNAMGRDKLGPN